MVLLLRPAQFVEQARSHRHQHAGGPCRRAPLERRSPGDGVFRSGNAQPALKRTRAAGLTLWGAKKRPRSYLRYAIIQTATQSGQPAADDLPPPNKRRDVQVSYEVLYLYLYIRHSMSAE